MLKQELDPPKKITNGRNYEPTSKVENREGGKRRETVWERLDSQSTNLIVCMHFSFTRKKVISETLYMRHRGGSNVWGSQGRGRWMSCQDHRGDCQIRPKKSDWIESRILPQDVPHRAPQGYYLQQPFASSKKRVNLQLRSRCWIASEMGQSARTSWLTPSSQILFARKKKDWWKSSNLVSHRPNRGA